MSFWSLFCQRIWAIYNTQEPRWSPKSAPVGINNIIYSLLLSHRDSKRHLLQYAFIAKTLLQSRTSLATLTVVMCNMSQCKLRSTCRNVRVTNVICIVTYYTLPPLESPDSFWMTRSQRYRHRIKSYSVCKQ